MLQRIAALVVFGGERRPSAGSGGMAAQPRIWRRLFHVVAGSCLPVAGILAPESGFVIALAVLAVGALLLDLSRFGIGPLNRVYLRLMAPLLKSDEESHITGATYMLIAAALVFWLFGKEVGVPVMLYLSLGDPAAAIVGRQMPGPRLLGKSPRRDGGIHCGGRCGSRHPRRSRGRRTPLGAVGRGSHCSLD